MPCLEELPDCRHTSKTCYNLYYKKTPAIPQSYNTHDIPPPFARLMPYLHELQDSFDFSMTYKTRAIFSRVAYLISYLQELHNSCHDARSYKTHVIPPRLRRLTRVVQVRRQVRRRLTEQRDNGTGTTAYNVADSSLAETISGVHTGRHSYASNQASYVASSNLR